ncbi:urease accessory protein UreD [Nitrospira sp. Kam-Ns4a]
MTLGPDLASVGRVGELSLDYAREGARTVLAHSRCCSPWHLVPPIALDGSGCAYTLLVNPSGGLVGGDQLVINATLNAQTHVLFSTPSATRVYRSISAPSVQEVELSVGPGAVVEWVPEVTIPYAGSRYHQTIHVALAAGATGLVWDAIASGRVARGERWAFASLESEVWIETASGQTVLERVAVGLDRGTSPAPGLSEWDYVGTLYLVNDAVEEQVWKRLQERLSEALDQQPGSVLGGVSEPAAPGLVVKLVARSAPDLQGALERLWSAVRSHLWNLPVPALRRY